MATRSKRRAKRRPKVDLFEQAERNLARGNAKQGLKDAKVCFRQDPSEAHHRLLERACLARAEELRRLGMRAECRSVLETLLDLGVTEPSVEQELPALLVTVGLFDRRIAGGEGTAPEADSSLLASAADHAVVRPNEAPKSLPEIGRGAGAVRAALRALYCGDESAAVERLKGIARNSPFADWKYFARGLAAYYRQDAAEMQANWQRLDPERFAARIAAPLRALADRGSADRRDRRVRRAMHEVAAEVLGGPLVSHLDSLRTHVGANRWKNAIESYRKAHRALREFDPELPGRIVDVLWTAILNKGESTRLTELASLVSPLPVDPHWNRAWALMWEHPKDRDIEEAERRWRDYLHDLAELPCLSPEERTLAQAMVWERIAGLYVAECRAVPPWYRTVHDPVPEMQSRAVECFEHSLRLAPKLLSTYEALAGAQQDWDQPEGARETYRRLLEHSPENLDALLFLAEELIKEDEPLEARQYALRALRLKPANQEITRLVWSVHVAAARHHALAGEWEKGRADFEAADQVLPAWKHEYYLVARRAVFELKARDFEVGERLVEQAQSQAGGPAPALLVLAIEATRYDLSRTPRASFQRQWKAALKKRCQSQAAGRMSAAMAAYLAGEVEYRGRSAHVEDLLRYLRRASRVKWQESDLRHVCDFLEISRRANFSEAGGLLLKLVSKGRKKFPECPLFPLLAGELEIERGPMRCDREYARACFQEALELAEGSGSPEDATVSERAKRGLTFLGEVDSAPSPYDQYDDDDVDDYDDDDGYDEYDAPDGGPFSGPPPEEFFDDEGGPFSSIPPGPLFAAFTRACAEMGLDPEEVLNRAASAGPLRIPRPKRSSEAKRKKKKRNKRR